MTTFWIIFAVVVIAIVLYGILSTQPPEHPTVIIPITKENPLGLMLLPTSDYRIVTSNTLDMYFVEKVKWDTDTLWRYRIERDYTGSWDYEDGPRPYRLFTEEDAEKYIAMHMKLDAENKLAKEKLLAWKENTPPRDVPPFKYVGES